MKRHFLYAAAALLLSATLGLSNAQAQQGPSTYEDGDSLARLVKMNYVYSFEDAIRLSHETKKPIFVNAFADFARPCHGMNAMVFSDEAFCKWMDKNFVCYFADMSRHENRHLAERYKILSYAHYLVLDQDGNIIHRIIGGAPLPEFQERVAAALSPRTSLSGTTEAYNKGDRSKKTLLAYLTALNNASEDSLFKAVLPQYEAQLKQADYLKKENWFITRRKAVEGSQSEMFRFIVDNRAKFDKNVGAEQVNTLLSNVYAGEIFSEAISGKPYDAAAMTDTYLDMQKAAVPDSFICYSIYNVCKAYGQRDFFKLLSLLPTLKNGVHRTITEVSLKFEDLTPEETKAVVDYYREREAVFRGYGSSYADAYKEIADNLEHPQVLNPDGTEAQGINFSTGAFDEIMAKAKEEGKLIFVDGYTVWCGPCKMLVKHTFPYVGEYFNQRFVSTQIDMEKGEGIELAKRWGVEAYPTLIILDADGNIKGKISGFRTPEQLIEEVKTIIEP